jgi:beta-aspartyl-peptidase (threonine type)
MSKLVCSVFAVVCFFSYLSSISMAQTNDPSPRKWAIAIHGGAGGNAATWTEEKKAKRLAGLKQALETGKAILMNGGTSLDAVEATIRVLEDDPTFNAGRGSVVTADGRAELDASIMDGKTHACGGVAAVTNVKNPISLARLVMTETKHVLLVSEGAEAFAAAQKVPLVDPSYFLSAQPVVDFDPILVQSKGQIDASIRTAILQREQVPVERTRSFTAALAIRQLLGQELTPPMRRVPYPGQALVKNSFVIVWPTIFQLR